MGAGLDLGEMTDNGVEPFPKGSILWHLKQEPLIGFGNRGIAQVLAQFRYLPITHSCAPLQHINGKASGKKGTIR
jgi:hypothetical protein